MFNMKKVFWGDPYQTSLQTKVADVFEDKILLEETIAFSFSGGQESDKAVINNLPVLGSVLEFADCKTIAGYQEI